MAAGVSSSPRPAYLHHPLSYAPANRPPSVLVNTLLANTTSSNSSPNPLFDSDSEPSPNSSTATASSFSLAASDTTASASASTSSSSSPSSSSSSSGRNSSCSQLNPNNHIINSNSFDSTPAASPISPHSPLEPVAESASSPASTSSPSPSRNRSHPQQQQLGANSARGDLNLKLHRTGGFFAFAASALDRTQSVISPTNLRQKRSLSRLSISGDTSALLLRGAEPASDNNSRQRRASLVPSLSASLSSAQPSGYRVPSSQTPAFSQPYTETDPSQPAPVFQPKIDNKMHQTSSRLLRMTDDDRPFTKDFKDLFATLIVSLLPLSAHRVRLTKVEHTFLSEDAINNLGSLKFSQSNRMPDPKDPSRIVTTTTTTTFSMAKDMARSICQRFLEARLIESADGKYQQVYTMKGSVWQLTAKGIAILDQFCSKNGIQQKQVAELIGNNLSTLVSLERDNSTDKLQTDRSTMEVVFRRFVGISGFNVKSNVTQADSESLADYKDGLTGVKMAAERKIGGKAFKETFTGKSATDWLMDCSTTVDRRETVEIANFFVEYELMECVQQDRAYMAQYPGSQIFQPTKHSIYQLTSRGRDLISGNGPRGRSSDNDMPPRGDMRINDKLPRDSNTQRLEKILSDPALRLLFRENLRETHCEENLSFYVDVDEFVKSCKQAIRHAQKNPSTTSMDGIKEIMAQAYGIYNAFLAPGSPCELNIDHQLRSNLATRMTKAVGQDVAMIDTLHEVTALFEDAQNAVFKLMASDSVPKFLRTPKYESVLKNYDFDSAQYSGKPIDRSQSRSNRK